MPPVTQNSHLWYLPKTHLFFRYAKPHYTPNLLSIKFKLKNETTGVVLTTLSTQNVKKDHFGSMVQGNRTLTQVSGKEPIQLFITNTKKATFNMAAVWLTI